MKEIMDLERATKVLGEAQQILAHQYNLSNGLDKDSIKYHLAIQIVLEEIYFNSISKNKLKELLDNNLEKENNEYIVDSNVCQCLVRHLIKILEGE